MRYILLTCCKNGTIGIIIREARHWPLELEKFVYEQRQVTLRPKSLNDYVQQIHEQSWPHLNNEGASVLCLLNGLIGLPAEEVIQITRFPDLASWHRYRTRVNLPGSPLVVKEEVRLLRPIASRPKVQMQPEDKKGVYGYQRAFIRPTDLAEFVRCSEDGIWPRIEAQGARVLGLWATLAETDPLEVVLMTGYNGPGHWEETRDNRPIPENFDATLWERNMELRAIRSRITIKSVVCLMRAIEVAPAD